MKKFLVTLGVVIFILLTIGTQVVARIITLQNLGWGQSRIVGEGIIGLSVLGACLCLAVIVGDKLGE